MFKTNSKEAIKNIRAYIMENADFSGYDEYSYIERMEEENARGTRNIDMFSVYAHALMNCFYNEKIKFDKRYEAGRITRFELFEEWCRGLPSVIDTCYYYNRSAKDDIAKILNESESEKERFTEAQAENKLTVLIYRELEKATNRF